METLGDFICRLQCMGARLWVDDERLRVRMTHGNLPSVDVASIRLLKSELVTALLDLQGDQVDSSGTRLRSTNLAPLTYRQESLWRLMQIDQTGANRLVIRTLRLTGPVDADALDRSFRAVGERHEALRTEIIERNGQPLQKIAPRLESPLEVIQLRPLFRETPCKCDDLQGDLCSLAFAPFNPLPGTMFRAKLFVLSPAESVLQVGMHHLVTDAISFTLFWSELWQLYDGFTAGSDAVLPGVQMQCADYAIWQRSNRFPWNGEYWQEMVECATRIQFPADVPFSASKADAGIGAGELLSLSPDLTRSLRELAHNENVMLGMVILSLYAALIVHECRQCEFTLPFQVSGRLYPQHTNMMGYFAHPLLLWIRVAGTESFSQLLRKVTRDFLQAQRNTDCGKLMAQAPRLFAGGLFQWSSYLEERPSSLNAADFPISLSAGNYVELVEQDVMLSMHETASAIEGYVMYRADLFTPIAIQRLLRSLLSLCEFVTTRPCEPLSSFLPRAFA